MPSNPPQYLTVAQIADIFQCSASTVYRVLIAEYDRGRAGIWRVPIEDAKRLFAAKPKPPQPAPTPTRATKPAVSVSDWRTRLKRH